jgi:hypothetical protein
MMASLRQHPTDEQLLRAIDEAADESPSRRVSAHLAACALCRQRQDALKHVILRTVTALRSDPSGRSADWHANRAQLERRLAAEVARRRPGIVRQARVTAGAVARWSTAVVLIVAVVITTRALRSRSEATTHRASAPIERDALPIAALTPGATIDLTLEQLCRGEHPGVEPADPGVRRRILKDYGMAEVAQHEYELDYLITPELGGANDRRNLWPERYADRKWNAKVKDQLEDLLPTLVCQGTIDLQTAQQDIAANWVEAYKKYFKTDVPLRSGT